MLRGILTSLLLLTEFSRKLNTEWLVNVATHTRVAKNRWKWSNHPFSRQSAFKVCIGSCTRELGQET